MDTLQERFDTKYEAVTESGCWIWAAQTNAKGYGRLRNDSGSTYAHRISYQLHKGNIPNDMLVLHDCDNPSCVNPEHLHLGSNADNMIEMYQRNRFPNQKLTLDKVKIILSRLKLGIKQKDIAKEFKVHFSTISDISTGKHWQHATGV